MNTDPGLIGNYCLQHLLCFYSAIDNLVGTQISYDSLPVISFHSQFFKVRKYRCIR